MKKTILTATALSLILFTGFTFAAKSEFDRIIEDTKYYSEEDQKKLFDNYVRRGSKNIKTLAMIGYLYYNGIGTPVDKNVALNMYKRSAELGDSNGMYLLGKYLIEENNDIEGGLTELVKASDKDNYQASEYIGHLYEDGKYVEKNNYYSLEYYHKSANAGSANSRLILAKKILDSGEEKNYKKGIDFLVASADLNNTEACLTLAKLYITENQFLSVDPQKHIQYLMCAADSGDKESIKTLAEYYAKGTIVMVDNDLSARYYGAYFGKRMGSPKNLEEANTYFDAGVAYYSVKKVKQAIEYFKAAAKAGHGEAAISLGRIYENGYGVKVDYKEASNYYKMAQKNGIDTSESVLRVESLKTR